MLFDPDPHIVIQLVSHLSWVFGVHVDDLSILALHCALLWPFMLFLLLLLVYLILCRLVQSLEQLFVDHVLPLLLVHLCLLIVWIALILRVPSCLFLL